MEVYRVHQVGTAAEPVRRGVWKLSWSAIWAGVLLALGVFMWLLLFGTGIGLATVDPYQIARHEGGWITGGTVAWVVISIIGTIFMGAYFAGRLSRTDREDALVHGGVVWALSILLVVAVVSIGTGLNGSTVANNQNLALSYSSLSDPQFTEFLLQRARNWRPGNPEEPVNVSAEVAQRVNPNRVPRNHNFKSFIMTNTRLTQDQTEEFLQSEKNIIAREEAAAQQRWEEDHAAELVAARQNRQRLTTAAGALTGIIFAALVAALGGAYLGSWSNSRQERRSKSAPPPPPATATATETTAPPSTTP